MSILNGCVNDHLFENHMFIENATKVLHEIIDECPFIYTFKTK